MFLTLCAYFHFLFFGKKFQKAPLRTEKVLNKKRGFVPVQCCFKRLLATIILLVTKLVICTISDEVNGLLKFYRCRLLRLLLTITACYCALAIIELLFTCADILEFSCSSAIYCASVIIELLFRRAVLVVTLLLFVLLLRVIAIAYCY